MDKTANLTTGLKYRRESTTLYLLGESGHVGGDGGRRDVGNVVEGGDRLLLEHAKILPFRIGGTRGAPENPWDSSQLDHVGLTAGHKLSQSFSGRLLVSLHSRGNR